MPLLNKRLFKPNPVPQGIVFGDPIYFCKHTKEVFLDHDEYFNRLVLLNSTTWSCALTRKTNLTYFEAIESEGNAEKELCDFPTFLEMPILFIVHKLTNRGRFEELVNDIYHIMKERFFNNEEVVFSERNRKCTARIVASYNSLGDNSGEQLACSSEMRDPVMPLPEFYFYTIEILDSEDEAEDRVRQNITYDRLFRSKNTGARQKIRLFLKNACHMAPDGDHYTVKDTFVDDLEHMTWTDVMAGPAPICPQTPVLQRGRIPNTLKPGYIEPVKKEKKQGKNEKDSGTPSRPRGRPPKTPEQKALAQEEKKQRKRREAGQEAYECDLTSSGALTLSSTPSTSAPAQKKSRVSMDKKKAKIQEQQEDLEFYFAEAKRLGIDVSGLEKVDKLLSGKVVADFKQKVKDEKDTERENIKEEKKKKIREKAAYNKKRDDLLCDDLKPMPRFPKLELPNWLSDEEFADYLFISQFFSAFKEILPLKEVRETEEISFSDIILAMKCNDPQNSPFADLMKVLLSIRTDIADEEDGDEADINNRDEVYLMNAQNCDPVNVTHGDSIRECSDLHFRIRKIHGKSVRHLPVDWMTLTEVLRLIFETSGYYTGIATHRHRLYARGNFRGYEDPAYEFRSLHPDIMEKLRTQTVFDLEPNERLEITKTLIYQLLTYSKFRSHIEKQQNEMFDLRKEQKKLKNWDIAQEAQANASRLLLEVTDASTATTSTNGTAQKDSGLVKRLKSYLKAYNEGRRYDKDELENILLDSVPYPSLDIDEILTARALQKTEYQRLMDDLVSKAFYLQCKVSDVRLGTDRAYRRYIVMKSLSAILVESLAPSEPIAECEKSSLIENKDFLESSGTHETFLCSGNVNNCSIHGPSRTERPRWSYIQSQEQLEELLTSLNPRGFRENELLEEINENRSSLLTIIEETENSRSEEEWKLQFMTDDSDPAETYNIDWDMEIRDLLLDFEEKIDQGQMGSMEKSFSVNRLTWREQLKTTGDVVSLLKESVKVYNEVLVDVEEIESYSEVRKLAVAFLLIVKCISFKFIKAPFLSPNKDEHGNAKPSELFIRWQRALLECESLSAVSLFISTFEASIKWDKSRLQGKCRSCRRKAVAQELVLCSECNSCYHLKCAKLKNDGEAIIDWLCATCRAQQRKIENEAKRLNRARRDAANEEMDINNMSITDDISPADANCTSSSISAAQIPVETIRTASGRAVKKIHYSHLHDGNSPKSRKSNGVSVSISNQSSITTSERPTRSSTKMLLDNDTENRLTDDEISESENGSSKKKKSAKKPSSVVSKTAPSVSNDNLRVTVQNTKEKMSAIESLLKEAMRQECSWPFLQPVDSKEVPDYYDVIKRPMDLRTMMNKIKQRIYNQPVEVRNDFQLILDNCETYNESESEIYELSQQLNEFVTSRLDAIVDE